MSSNIFSSQDNKALIWQLLMEADAFDNIPNNYANEIQNMYEKIITEVSQLANTNLKDKNKLVMSKMFEQIKYFQTTNIQKPLEEVKIKIQEEFKNKQEEFIQLVNHNRPKDVSFNEEIDKPFNNEELNTKLNEIITSRSYDVISDNLKTSTINNESEKKVRFIPTPDSILSKLKTKNSEHNDSNDSNDSNNDSNKSINDIYKLLQNISINQDKILEILNNSKY